jgi:hypothetical protein
VRFARTTAHTQDNMVLTLVVVAIYAQQKYRWHAATAAQRATLAEPYITKAMVQATVLLLANQLYYYVTGYTVIGTAAIYSFVSSHCDSFDSDARVLASAITLGVLGFGVIVVAAVVDALLGLGTVALHGDAPALVIEPLNAAVDGLAGAVAAADDDIYYDAVSELQDVNGVNDGGVRTKRGLEVLLHTAVQRALRAEQRAAVLEGEVANADAADTVQENRADDKDTQLREAMRKLDAIKQRFEAVTGTTIALAHL